MLMIRLQRVGRKHQPAFRLVLTDSKNSPKSGKFLEILGSYNTNDEKSLVIKEDRVKHWISKGAQASDTVHNILISKKIIQGKKINKLPKKTAPVKEQLEEEMKQENIEVKPVESEEEKVANVEEKVVE